MWEIFVILKCKTYGAKSFDYMHTMFAWPITNYFNWLSSNGFFYFVSNLSLCVFDLLRFRYVFSAPDQLLESMPGTLMLTDCLEACQANESCGAVNYETGLCVLFSSNADKLPGMCWDAEKRINI